MSWTYSGDVVNSYLDWIRFTIGDTNADEPLMTDEEIEGVYSLNNENQKAAAKTCMQHILIILAQAVTFKLGTTSVEASDKYKNYKMQYDAFVSGLSNGSIQPQIPTGHAPIFNVGMHDDLY